MKAAECCRFHLPFGAGTRSILMKVRVMNVHKIIAGMLVLFSAVAAVSAAGARDTAGIPDEIAVISREAGSGTRGAFIELFGVEQTVNGKKVDGTADTADITNSTEVVITTVAGNKAAIGYISLGSLNGTVKAVKIDGADPTVAAVKSGSYKISRPFNIITKTVGSSPAAGEFVRYILSADGQAVIEKNGYISAVKNPPYLANVKTGKVTLAGSSSVFPVMEKLAEAYRLKNPGVTVEVSQSDSTTGINSAIQGVCDIGMASRNPKDSELSQGIRNTVIAVDGIAVIVNRANPVSDIPKDAVRKIYTGDVTEWSRLDR